MTGPGGLIGGRYRLERRLAAGGMGSVWLGQDERLHRPVAIKQLHVQPGLSPEAAELASQRAMREARITARLHHPHAVPVWDVVDDNGLPCLIMQYLPSTSLSEMLRDKGSLAPPVVARIGAEVASALAAAHELGIVHRDVKPGNVLIAEDGSAKVTDFGVSHAVGDVSLTSTGLVTGTPAFLAPEVARGAETAFSADVYGLGATLYDALEGQPPFGTDENPMAMLHKVASGQVIPPRQSGPLAPLLLRMLATDPRARPPMLDVARTLGALAADIDAATPLTQRFGPPPTATQRIAPLPVNPTTTMPVLPVADPARRPDAARPGSASPPPRSSRSGLMAALVVLVVLAAAVIGLLLVRKHNQNNANPSGPSVPVVSAPRKTASAPKTASPPTTASAPSTDASTPQNPSSANTGEPSSPSSDPSSQSSASSPPAGPSGAELAQAITDYYALLPSNTDAAWSRLTKNYQKSTAKNRKAFQDFWSSIDSVDVANASGSAPNSASATITYHYQNGSTVVEQTNYTLVQQDGVLKIDSSQVANSQSQ